MYSSFYNQLNQLSHFIFAIIVLFIALPGVLFRRQYKNLLDHLVSNCILMVFLLIVLGYALVVLKIYELVAILASLSSDMSINSLIGQIGFNRVRLYCRIC